MALELPGRKAAVIAILRGWHLGQAALWLLEECPYWDYQEEGNEVLPRLEGREIQSIPER